MNRRFTWAAVFSLAFVCLSIGFSRLADFSVGAVDEISLQAAIAAPAPASSATLNGILDEISIRTALEDTQRLRFELG